MLYNTFEIVNASAYTENTRGGGKLLQFGERTSYSGNATDFSGKAEADVQSLNFAVPDCVAIRIGTSTEPIDGKLAIEIDIDRKTALILSDLMLASIGAGKPVWHQDSVVRQVRVWDGTGKSYLSVSDIKLLLIRDSTFDHWHIQMEKHSDKGLRKALISVHFDSDNARILAELLRVMAFR